MMDFEVALDQFEIFILILMRMASFVYTAPFFNTSDMHVGKDQALMCV